jgi:hypothetical protein
MKKKTCKHLLSSRLILFLFAVMGLPQSPVQAEKVGVLFLHVGETEQYQFDSIQYQLNIFDILPPGFFAGSSLEGGDCYSMIHYADNAEAAICGVDEGTPIDAFCHEYTGNDTVHSIASHSLLGDRTFGQRCYKGLFPYVLLLSDSTRDPRSGEEIVGPHVDDPDGSGIGIADFFESYYFDMMHFMFQIPDRRQPQREQLLRWWYGNDAPGFLPLSSEQANIKDLLIKQSPATEFAFRHSWEMYMRNEDVYGNPAFFPDSTETAITELINDEGVDRIVVFHSFPSFSNFTQYGHEWYDSSGNGVSTLVGKTFKECVNDLYDGAGPETMKERDNYLKNKPWDKHINHPFPFIKRMVDEIDQTVKLTFTPGYGKFIQFGEAVLAMLRHTVSKYSIPRSAALKVILVHHGFSGGYSNAQNCDCYDKNIEQLFVGVQKTIIDSFSWNSRFELVHAAGEFAEGTDDPASRFRPFGKVISQGEHIDMAINGKYVSQTGMLVDNGLDNFDYIIAIPYYFDAESYDTIFVKRQPLGNNIPGGFGNYVRDMRDADGTTYNADDYDAEYFTKKIYDGTGWPSRPKFRLKTFYKGSVIRPTTLIITGALLSAADGGAVKQSLTEAAVSAIEEALK